MSFLKRHEPDATTKDGQRVHVLGDPFRVTEIPGAPGILWQGVVCPDGKLRPVPVEELKRDG